MKTLFTLLGSLLFGTTIVYAATILTPDGFITTNPNTTSQVRGTLQAATTTISVLNGVINVDGIHYARTSTGIQQAVNQCFAITCGKVFLPPGVYTMTNPVRLATSTILEGAGQDATILRLDPASLLNFHFQYMLEPFSTSVPLGSPNVIVKNMTLDGNYSNLVAPPSNYGGSLLPGNYWTIDHVTFFTSNYFRMFPTNTNHLVIRNSIFSGTGSSNDSIGGGDNTNELVENNLFTADPTGNIFDQVRGSYITFRNNTDELSTHNLYFEGVTDSTIENNLFNGGGSLVIETEAGYSDKTYITNPKNIKILNNTIKGGGYIDIAMTDEVGHASALSHTNGGANIISGNHIENSIRSSIFFNLKSSGLDDGGNVISNNTIVSGNTATASTWNTGSGIMNTSGINVMKGSGFSVTGNTIMATSSTYMQYGVEVGQNFSQSTTNEPNNVEVYANSCLASSTVTGICTHVVNPTYTTDYTRADSLQGIDIHSASSTVTPCFAVNGACVGNQWTAVGNDIYYANGATGYVGIGTSTPDYFLTINPRDLSSNMNLLHLGNKTDNYGGTRLLIQNAWTGNDETDSSLDIQNAGGSVFDVTGAGRVGVATSSPDSVVSILGDGGVALLHVGNTANIGVTKALFENGWTAPGVYGIKVQRNSANPQFVVDGSGFVGVGTSTPSVRFTVWGADTSNTTPSMSVINSASTTLFTVMNGGNVGISTSSPFATLSVVGTTYLTGSVTLAALTTGCVQSTAGVLSSTGTTCATTVYSETPGGLINGSNTVYTTAHAITTVVSLSINGEVVHPSEYVVSGSGFTMNTALSALLSGTGFTISYQ